MAVKKVTYKEPAGYFTPEMLQKAQEWDKAHSEKSSTGTTKSSGTKKK